MGSGTMLKKLTVNCSTGLEKTFLVTAVSLQGVDQLTSLISGVFVTARGGGQKGKSQCRLCIPLNSLRGTSFWIYGEVCDLFQCEWKK